MPNNYDPVAFFYDPLAGLVFGKALRRSQAAWLGLIPAGSRILIAGGGTGQILEDLTAIRPSGLIIFYVEVSGAMIRKARQRDTGNNQVIFLQQAVETFRSGEPFDVIFTAFLFDNFSKHRVSRAFEQMHVQLKPGGLWLFTDFHYERGRSAWWQPLLFHTMLYFFRILCRVEARGLNDMSPYFSTHQYTLHGEKWFFHHFIRTAVWIRQA